MTTQKFGMVFPGQGSQSVGMLTKLSAKYSIVKTIFTQASERLGYDLWELAQQGPKEKLDQTEYTQPALLAAGVAVWHCWKEEGNCEPSVLAGHSLGEYTALACAKAITFEDAIELVSLRGAWMQAAVPAGRGAMAAIVGLDDADVVAICREVAVQNEILAPANFNSIGQVVIAGDAAAVERAIVLAEQKGARLAKKIPVSAPSHCPLMQSAADKMAEKLNNIVISLPQIPVIQNYDVEVHTDVNSIKKALVMQLTHPVRWVETIQYIVNQNVACLLECGPGKVLAGLNKRISKSLETFSLEEPDSLYEAAQRLKGVEVCLSKDESH